MFSPKGMAELPFVDITGVYPQLQLFFLKKSDAQKTPPKRG
tara:strand:+ start:430 stop:552 length:123 start_codon:yes stop_codon:yes gene_type:complete